jgi:hypothetical protein
LDPKLKYLQFLIPNLEQKQQKNVELLQGSKKPNKLIETTINVFFFQLAKQSQAKISGTLKVNQSHLLR